MKVDPAIERLLIRAGILSKYHQRTWFAGCSLHANILTVPDALQARVITLSYLDDLRTARSDLQLRVSLGMTKPAAYRGASREPNQPRLDD